MRQKWNSAKGFQNILQNDCVPNQCVSNVRESCFCLCFFFICKLIKGCWWHILWTTKSSLISLIKFWKANSLLERSESCFLSFIGELFNKYLVMPVVINSLQNKIVTIQHPNQSIIMLTQCALHQLVHTLTGWNCMCFKIFLECFILTNETKIPLNGLVLGACYNTCLWRSWNLFSTCKIYLICFENTAVL